MRRGRDRPARSANLASGIHLGATTLAPVDFVIGAFRWLSAPSGCLETRTPLKKANEVKKIGTQIGVPSMEMRRKGRTATNIVIVSAGCQTRILKGRALLP
jgi:hypothetical protein